MNNINVNSNTAIIGLGKIGGAIASNLTKGEHSVILASREIEKAETLAKKFGVLATAKTISEAIEAADVIIPAIYFNSLIEFFQTYSNVLDGKIIVDVSNPIAPDGNGGFKKIIGDNESAGKYFSDRIPKNAKLVKAFGTVSAGSLLGEAFQKPERKVLFYASGHATSNRQIEELISSSGFEPYHVGGIDQSIRIEVFGDLHEFGGLGKMVTRFEAQNIISHN